MAKQSQTLRIRKSRRPRARKVFLVAGLLILLAGLATGGFFLIQYLNKPETESTLPDPDPVEILDLDTEPITDEEKDNYTVAPDRPRYLHAPSIGVNRARIVEVGVTAPNETGSQQMDAPKNINDVGWYNCQRNPIAANACLSPNPPGSGNTETAAILDGHTCFSRTATCVFDQLKNLRAGETITVELGDGTQINYTVKLVEVKELADVDMAKLMAPLESGKEGLNIISCAGRYRGTTDINGALTASQRVLVWAVRED